MPRPSHSGGCPFLKPRRGGRQPDFVTTAQGQPGCPVGECTQDPRAELGVCLLRGREQKRYDPSFVERPLLLQKLDEARHLPVQLHDHPVRGDKPTHTGLRPSPPSPLHSRATGPSARKPTSAGSPGLGRNPDREPLKTWRRPAGSLWEEGRSPGNPWQAARCSQIPQLEDSAIRAPQRLPPGPQVRLPEPRVLGEALHSGPCMVAPGLQLDRYPQGQAHRFLVLLITQTCSDRKGTVTPSDCAHITPLRLPVPTPTFGVTQLLQGSAHGRFDPQVPPFVAHSGGSGKAFQRSTEAQTAVSGQHAERGALGRPGLHAQHMEWGLWGAPPIGWRRIRFASGHPLA